MGSPPHCMPQRVLVSSYSDGLCTVPSCCIAMSLEHSGFEPAVISSTLIEHIQSPMTAQGSHTWIPRRPAHKRFLCFMVLMLQLLVGQGIVGDQLCGTVPLGSLPACGCEKSAAGPGPPRGPGAFCGWCRRGGTLERALCR